MVHVLLNAVGVSCKRKLILTESNRKRMEEGISKGTIMTWIGLNQDLSLKWPGNTCWGSHYRTLLRLGEMFDCIIEVLEHIQTEGMDGSKRQQAFVSSNIFTHVILCFISSWCLLSWDSLVTSQKLYRNDNKRSWMLFHLLYLRNDSYRSLGTKHGRILCG